MANMASSFLVFNEDLNNAHFLQPTDSYYEPLSGVGALIRDRSSLALRVTTYKPVLVGEELYQLTSEALVNILEDGRYSKPSTRETVQITSPNGAVLECATYELKSELQKIFNQSVYRN
jgi:hypothetical protein